MSSHDEIMIEARDLGKTYRIWKDPAARLKFPLLKALVSPLPNDWRPETLKEGFHESPFYRDFSALNGVSFQVKRGEAVGIIGRNGSGKSTLLQMVAGTLTPSTGSITTRGRVAALLELGSGFNYEFTGRENVYLYGSILGFSRQQVSEIFDDIAAFADIGDFIDQPVKTYSSGMTLRLAFAVMAHVRAEVLIIDEALAVGDVFFVQKCMRWIRKFREEGTLLFVTHNTADVMSLCDRAIWLKEGKLEMQGPAKDVAETYLAHYHTASTGGKMVPRQVSQSGSARKGLLEPVDQRLPWLNSTQFRNDITPTLFDPDQAWFGAGKAKIVNAEFVDSTSGAPILHIVGGEWVTLRITAEALEPLINPIIGFYIKDRLGQQLFGDNTYLTNLGRDIQVPQGAKVRGEFTFQMPLLPRGKYAISPAIATGTQSEHTQQCWIHEALVIESTNGLTHRGLVAIPMAKIETVIET